MELSQLRRNFDRLSKAGKLKEFMFDEDILTGYRGRKADLTLPNCFSGIAEGAFEGNTSLRRVTIPDSYVIIKERAFFKCKSLKTVELGSVIYIENSAFAGCNLWRLVIPKTMSSVGDLSFSDNSSLRIIEIESDSVWFSNNTFRGCDGVVLMNMPKKLMVGNIGLDINNIDVEYT